MHDQMANVKVFLMAATCDKPAEALVQNTAEPIGKFGCGQCQLPGKYFLLTYFVRSQFTDEEPMKSD